MAFLPAANSPFGLFQSSSSMDCSQNNFPSTSSIFGVGGWGTSEMHIGNQRGTSAVSYRTTPGEGGSSDKILSISAMPAYVNQSHEELRSQDYELKIKCNLLGGSGIAPFVATQVNDEANRYSCDKLQSISAMPVYVDKSHEELRSEDYEAKILRNKGVTSPFAVHPGTPANMFSHPTTSNQTTSDSPFSPFKSNMFTSTSQSPFSPNANPTAPNAPSTSIFSASANSFSNQRNPFSPHPQTFVSPSSTTTFPAPTPGTNLFSTNSSNIFSPTPTPTTSVSPFSLSSSTNVFSPQSHNWFNPRSTTTSTPANVTASPFSQTNLFSTQAQASVTPASTASTTSWNASSGNAFSLQNNPFVHQSQDFVTPTSTTTTNPWNASSRNPFSPQTNQFANQSQAVVTSTSTTASNAWNNSSANPFSSQTSPFPNQSQAFVTSTNTATSTPWSNSAAKPFPQQSNPFAPTSTTTSTAWNNSSANPFSPQTSPFSNQSQAFVTSINTATSTPWSNSAANPFPLQSNPFATKSQASVIPTSTTTSTPWNNSSANPFSPGTNLFTTQSQAIVTPTSTTATTPWNHSSVNPFSPQTNPFATKSQTFVTPTSTTTCCCIPSNNSSANPFSLQTNPFAIKSQASVTPFTTTNTCTPWNNSSPNPFSPGLQFSTQPQALVNPTSTTTGTPWNHSSVNPFTSSFISPSIWSTSVTTLGPCTPVPNASQPGQVSATIPDQPTNVPSSLITVAEVGSQNINGQQRASSSTMGLVVDPFSLRPQTNIHAEAVAPFTRGISSLPTQVLDNPRPFRMASSYRIRHMSRHISLPAQSSEFKVPFFSDKEERPCLTAPLPRENTRAWVMNTVHVRDHDRIDTSKKGEVCKEEACTSPCFKMSANSIEVNNDTFLQEETLIAEKLNKAENVSALMPKLPPEEYYTEPSIKELEAKERVDSGFCSHVKNFVVGRKGKGSIKFLGETDIRQLDLSSIVQFNEREVIVYSDERDKPPVGQGLNRPAEITLLNIKCISKKTGKQCTDGPLVQKLERKLMEKATELGAEFVSYNPIRAEWKFRVQHF